MQKICRTCLHEVSDSNYISFEADMKSMEIKTKLFQLIPEMVVNQVQNPILCVTCVGAVNFAYDFKNQCLHTEERIQNYKRNSKLDRDTGYVVNLSEVLKVSTKTKSFRYEANLHGIANDVDNDNTDILESTQKWCAVFEDQTKVTVKNETNIFATGLAQWPDNNCETNPDWSSDYNETIQECSVKFVNFCEEEIDQKIKFDNVFVKDINNLRKNHSANTSSNQISCHMCNYVAPNKTELKRHMTHHTGEKLYVCDICKYNTAEKYILMRHIRLVHSGEKPFTCNLCEFRTSRKCNLIDHARIHTGEKPFKCSFCGHTFAQRSNLKSHMKTHVKKERSKEKQFACNFCDFRAVRKIGLKLHMRKHTQGSDPICDLCNKRFTCKSSLRLHQTTVHDVGKPFTCDMCEFQTARKDYMKVHMKIHTGEKPFACSMCEFKAMQKSNLKNHIMRRHVKN